MSTRRLFQLLFVVALYALTVRHTTDPDMWWHLRTGEIIIAQGIPAAGPLFLHGRPPPVGDS
jgi:hypothetical protein